MVRQSARTEYGFTVSGITKINFTLSYDGQSNPSTNYSWRPNQSLTLEFLAHADKFAGLTEDVVFSLQFLRKPGRHQNPCFISLFNKNSDALNKQNAKKETNLVNFCSHEVTDLTNKYRDFVGPDGDRSLAVEIGLVPVVVNNHQESLEVIVRVDGQILISELINASEVAFVAHQLYYARITTN